MSVVKVPGLSQMIHLQTCLITFPHALKQILQVVWVHLGVKQWTGSTGFPHLGLHALQAGEGNTTKCYFTSIFIKSPQLEANRQPPFQYNEVQLLVCLIIKNLWALFTVGRGVVFFQKVTYEYSLYFLLHLNLEL